MLEVVNTIAPDPDAGRCVGVAHVHHDPGKMGHYNETLGGDSERFFTDREDADGWLLAVRGD